MVFDLFIQTLIDPIQASSGGLFIDLLFIVLYMALTIPGAYRGYTFAIQISSAVMFILSISTWYLSTTFGLFPEPNILYVASSATFFIISSYLGTTNKF